MQKLNIGGVIRKFFLSAFVIVSFVSYALEQNLASSQKKTADSPASNPTSQQQAQLFQPSATPIPGALYKDGTFTGPEVDVYYGLVQIKAIIQDEVISDVQFLEFPNDQTTSRYINSQVMPWLKQEAIQAQTANVNIISGATLTSEGFIMSLKAALQTAKN